MKRTIEVCKALSDESRFRIFMLLASRKMCVCEFLEILDIAGSTLSAHLKILKQAGLIDQHKDGRWIEYFLNTADPEIASLYTFLDTQMVQDRSVIEEDRAIAATLTREVCSRQRG